MKHTLLALIAAMAFVFGANAQNVGQEGDTLLNYIDINGLKQGHWVKKYTNGIVEYDAYFVDNKPVGDFKRYTRNGDLYAHLFYKNEGKDADVTFYHRNGRVSAKGRYLNHKKDSTWNYYAATGVHYLQENYQDGLLHGRATQFTSERKKFEEVDWVHGVKNGIWRRYYINGQVQFEVPYVDGKLHGEGKMYYESGTLHKKGKYVNDLMEGSWLIYKTNGGFDRLYTYKHGVCEELNEQQNKEINELERNVGQMQDLDPATHMNDPMWLMRDDR